MNSTAAPIRPRVTPPITAAWRTRSRRSVSIRRSISSADSPMRSDPKSPIGTVTSSESIADGGQPRRPSTPGARPSWSRPAARPPRARAGAPDRRRRHRDLALGAPLHHQDAVPVGDLERLHDLALAQDRVDVGERLLLERDRGEEVAARALGAALDLPREVARLLPRLEQHAVELALRQRAEDQPGEERDVAEDEEPEEGRQDPETPATGAARRAARPWRSR